MQTRLIEWRAKQILNWNLKHIANLILYLPFGILGSFAIRVYTLYERFQVEDTYKEMSKFFENRTNYPNDEAYTATIERKSN